MRCWRRVDAGGRRGTARDEGRGSPLMLSVRGLGIRFKTSHGIWQATRKIDFRHGAGRARRHCRRKRLRQDHHRAVDPAAAAEHSPASTVRSASTASISPNAARSKCARSGVGALRWSFRSRQRARSGLQRRPPDRRDATGPHRRQPRRGAGKDARHAAPGGHCLTGAAH